MGKALQIKSWRERNPLKVRAHRKIFVALRNKTIIKQPCIICLDKKSEAHHNDYSKPLEVIWLCKRHHVMADINLRKGLSTPTLAKD